MKNKIAIYNPNNHKSYLVKLNDNELPVIADSVKLNDIYGVIFTPSEYTLNTKERKVEVKRNEAEYKDGNSKLFNTLFTVRIGRIVYFIKVEIYSGINAVKKDVKYYNEHKDQLIKSIENEAKLAFRANTVEY